jgi:hypothetical protein
MYKRGSSDLPSHAASAPGLPFRHICEQRRFQGLRIRKLMPVVQGCEVLSVDMAKPVEFKRLRPVVGISQHGREGRSKPLTAFDVRTVGKRYWL